MSPSASPRPASTTPTAAAPAQHVFFATRTADWRVHAAWAECMIATLFLLQANGIRASLRVLSGGNVLLAQNRLLAEFLNSPCTDFFTVDSDMAWDPASALRLLLHDVDVVACEYPRRERLAHPGFACPDALVPSSPKPSLLHDGTGTLLRDPASGLLAAPLVKGGFQRIRRSAIERLIEHYCPEDQPPGSGGTLRLRDGTIMLFDSTITEDGDLADDNSTFCERWRRIGGDLWLDGDGHFEHIGPASYYHPPINQLLGVAALMHPKVQTAAQAAEDEVPPPDSPAPAPSPPASPLLVPQA